MTQSFADRHSAGRELARLVARQVTILPDAIVLALPRGGVPVGAEVAAAIHAELDILVVRKLGLPGYAELAMGAIASGGVRVLNDDVIMLHGVDSGAIEAVARVEGEELARRERAYRGDRPAPVLTGRQVFLVDDGLATGATMRAAVAAVRRQQPRQLIVAVPVAAADTVERLSFEVDAVVCVEVPELFMAIGQFYADFSQTTDAEVRQLLQQAWQRGEASTS